MYMYMSDMDKFVDLLVFGCQKYVNCKEARNLGRADLKALSSQQVRIVGA